MSFNLILGCMFSGKTSELIDRYNRHTIGGRKCIVIKYKGDTRYNHSSLITHDYKEIKEAVVCQLLYQVHHLVKEYDVICVDEVQFYKDAPYFCDLWASQGKIVEACGLNGMFNKKPFPIISQLVPQVDNLTFKKAVCRQTGNDGIYSQLNPNHQDESKDEIIGGDDIYEAVDRVTYNKHNQNKLPNEFREWVKQNYDLTKQQRNTIIESYQNSTKIDMPIALNSNIIMDKRSVYQQIVEFNLEFGHPVNENPIKSVKNLDAETLKMKVGLIEEELGELKDAIANDDMVEVFDALGDISYVVNGLATYVGCDMDTVVSMIHKSNMSKMCVSEEEAQQTVDWYKAEFEAGRLEYDSPAYRCSPCGDKWVVYNANGGKILKSINYKPVALSGLFD